MCRKTKETFMKLTLTILSYLLVAVGAMVGFCIWAGLFVSQYP
jgi:nitrate reductase NapE component